MSRGQIIASLFWRLLERGGARGVELIVQVVLARLLLPDDYGVIALMMVLISLANVFIQRGFSSALIQKKDADDVDFSSVFYLSLLLACVMYIVIFLASPLVADFYGQDQLVPVLRALAALLFFGAFNSIQNAVVARRMQFKRLFFSSLGAMLASGAVGIMMAYAGFGIWALVFQQLTNQAISTTILWFTVRWRPKKAFSPQRVRVLFSYGWKLLVSSLVETLYMDLRSLIIGKMYSTQMLGFYDKGKQFPMALISAINSSIQSVMFPALSSQQDDKRRVKAMVRRSIVTSSFLIFPMMVGLTVVAEPLVKLLLTERWLPCVPFLQISCITYGLWPIHTANLQAINALGHSDVFLRLEITKKILGLAILWATLPYGIYAIAMGGILSGLVSMVINSYPNIKLLDYGVTEQCKDIAPSLSLALLMGILAQSVKFLGMSSEITLVLQVLVGIGSYFGLAGVFRLECFDYILSICRQMYLNRGGIGA